MTIPETINLNSGKRLSIKRVVMPLEVRVNGRWVVVDGVTTEVIYGDMRFHYSDVSDDPTCSQLLVSAWDPETGEAYPLLITAE